LETIAVEFSVFVIELFDKHSFDIVVSFEDSC